MAVIEGRTWLEVLAPPACWRLIALTPVGRVALVVEGDPEIFPVNFAVVDNTLVFRTARGAKLASLFKRGSVCFEVDGFDRHRRSGWSVMVKGDAHLVSSVEELATVRSAPLSFWAPGEKDYFVRIVPREVTGRRIVK